MLMISSSYSQRGFFDNFAKFASVSAALILVAACGGSGGSYAGIEGTGSPMVASGTVSSYGSVYVNGVRYNTDSAVIEIDGMNASEEALGLGMVVRIEGTLSGEGLATAQRIVHDRGLRGPVSRVASSTAATKELTVLGQRVVVHDDIVFENTVFESLSEGVHYSVSGYLDSTGSWVATRVEDKSDDVSDIAYEVEGFVTALEDVQLRFSIGSLTVSYAGAHFAPRSDDELQEGFLVEVIGSHVDESGALLAEQIRRKSRQVPAPQGSTVEIEGPIEAFASIGEFQVQGVTVNGSTADIRRGSAEDLSEGVKVVVKGKTDVHGRLVAESMVLNLPSDVRLRGAVEAVDLQTGRITLLGMHFYIDELTAYEDRSPVADRYIRLDDITVGDQLEVYARTNGDSRVITRIRRLGADNAPGFVRGLR